MARARETYPYGKLSQERAALWLAEVTMRNLDPSTVSRMELRGEIPSGHKSGPVRRNAYLLCVLYEVDPADLGLSPGDGPGELAVLSLRKHLPISLLTHTATSDCYGGDYWSSDRAA